MAVYSTVQNTTLIKKNGKVGEEICLLQKKYPEENQRGRKTGISVEHPHMGKN